MAQDKITVDYFRRCKAEGVRIPALTAYDYPMTRLLDEAGVPLILVGDTLGMVVLGYPDTTHVKMDEMIHHVKAVARAKPRSLVAADLPYRSYETPESAVANARRLIDAGAEAVKAEGGHEIAAQVKAMTSEGILFIGHLGMLPQHILEEGGKYRIKGKNEEQHAALLADAKGLVEAGAFAIVLECVTPPVANEITGAVPIPTIGIGSGPGCDGQILVTHDLIGAFPWFRPRFVQPKLNAAEQIKLAITDWILEIKQ